MSTGAGSQHRESTATDGALHFGLEGRRRYAFFQAGEGASADLPAILIVPPIGPDAERQHRAMRQLAAHAARQGMPSLRFDFLGHGDSDLASREACWTDWEEDVALAQIELASRTPGRAVAVVAFGLGALAAQRALSTKTLWAFVLVDAPVDGRAWWEELDRSQRDLVRRSSARWPEASDEAPVERLGFEFDRRVVESITTTRCGDSGPWTTRLLVAATAAEPPAAAWVGSIEAAAHAKATILHHPWPAGLDDDPFKPRVPQPLIQALLSAFRGGSK